MEIWHNKKLQKLTLSQFAKYCIHNKFTFMTFW